MGLLNTLGRFLGLQNKPQVQVPTPQQVADIDYDGGGLLAEDARSGPAGILLPWFYPYYDSTQPVPARLLRKMFTNPYVKSAMLGKLLGVAALDLQVRPANKKNSQDQIVSEFVEWQWRERLRGGVPDLAWNVLAPGLIEGYSVSENIFQRQQGGRWSGMIVVDQLKQKDIGNDVILKTDSYRNIVSVMGLRYNAGLNFDPEDFTIWQHLPFFHSPAGTADFASVYNSWWMLDCVTKLWMISSEKRSIPMLMGEYTTATQKTGLEGALAKARSQTWLAVPAGVKVTALNMAGSSASDYDKFTNTLKHDIFLGLQGSVLSSLEGTVPGGRGSSAVHKSTADLFKWYLASQLGNVLQALTKQIVDLNFHVSEYPRVQLSSVDVNELVQELAIDTGLHGLVPLSADELYDRYGRTPPENTSDAVKPSPPPGQGAPPGAPAGKMDDAVGILTQRPRPEMAAAGVAAGSEFRGFSEQWQRYLRGA